VASIEAERSKARVRLTAQSYPALRAALSQESTWSGPRWRCIHRQLLPAWLYLPRPCGRAPSALAFRPEKRPWRMPVFGG